MIFDSLKYQTLRAFMCKVAEAGCCLRQREPESLWQIAAEVRIHELKRGPVRKTTKMKSPKVIRSNMVLEIFELDGMNP